MPDIQIRLAKRGDHPALVRLLAQLSDEPETITESLAANVLDAVLATPAISLIVAEDEGTLVGTATLVVVPNLTHGGRPWAQLENMVVDAGHRAMGIGSAILAEARRLAADRDCYKIQLQSANARTDAHRFYEREGFVASSKGYRRYETR